MGVSSFCHSASDRCTAFLLISMTTFDGKPQADFSVLMMAIRVARNRIYSSGSTRRDFDDVKSNHGCTRINTDYARAEPIPNQLTVMRQLSTPPIPNRHPCSNVSIRGSNLSLRLHRHASVRKLCVQP